MPNHLSTHHLLFYYSSFDEWGVWRRKEKCGADEKDGWIGVKMVRIKVEKG